MSLQSRPYPSLHLDILHRVAEIVTRKLPPDPTDMRNFSLVNRDFSAVFHPLVFYYTQIHPRENRAVRDLHVTMTARDPNGMDDIRELLSSFTNIKSLRVSGSGTRPDPAAEVWRNWPLATSIERLCKLPTLELLECFYLGRIPASWLTFSNSLTSVLLARTWPSLDVEPSQNDAGSVGSSQPNKQMPCEGINAAFDKFVSVLGAMSPLENLTVIMEDESSSRSYSEVDMLFPSLKNLHFLQSFDFECVNGSSMFLSTFVSTLPRTIASLDTTFLQHFHISFGHVQTSDLESLLHMFTAAEGSLNRTFASKLARRELDELEEVQVIIQVDTYILESIPPAKEQIRALKKTPLLPSLPQEKLRVVVLGEFCSNNKNQLLYDSKGPM
ncbi:hypothetical protein NMY22_g5516 [Coprinellus aureogranulatus]|nr:hypothetical protein NMY22_g5516 [Coprinellus aureogranulatus]